MQHRVAVLLRQASTDGDLHVGVGLLARNEVADVSVQLVVGVLPHRAGVEHDDVGVDSVGGPLISGRVEQAGEPLGVVDVHLAAVRADLIGATLDAGIGAVQPSPARHRRSHGPIVRAVPRQTQFSQIGRIPESPASLRVAWVVSGRMETGASESAVNEPTPHGTPMISMKAVNKHFGDLHVLKDINLDVDRGQVVVVLGPSGSGKSTLCRTINRLEPIDSGTIEIDGEVLPAEGRKLAQLRADVGMVFQSFNLFAHKTILENVTLAPMKVRKESKDQARANGDGTARAGRHREPGGQVSGPAVRRAAAAGGDRAVAGDEPQGDVVRRAHQRARSRDDQRGLGGHDVACRARA